MEDEIMRTALAPGAGCLSSEQLGRYADGALGAEEQAAAEIHIRGCLTCQAELALLHAMTSSGVRDNEAEIVRDGVARLEQHATDMFRGDRVKPSSWRPSVRVGTFPLAAVAAVLLVGIATGSYFLGTRTAPDLPSRVTTGDEITRSPAVRLRGPIGDQEELPRRFEWLAVDRAVRYRVRLMEVDRQEVWSASTSAPGVDLPASAQTAIAPARTMVWDVTAYDAAGTAIAESGPQSFRLVPR
jgi:hypothetical protein